MKITKKDERKEEQKQEAQELEDERSFLSKLDIGKHLVDVHGALKKDITTDFTMSKMEEKDKQFVIDITSDAYFAKFIYDPLINALEIRKAVWQQLYPKASNEVKIMEIEIAKIRQLKVKTFDSLMKKPYMMVIMNRNVAKNPLLRIVAGLEEEEERMMEDQEVQRKGVVANLTKLFKRERAEEA